MAGRRRPRSRALSWPSLVRADLAKLRAKRSADRAGALEAAGPRLIDTVHRDEVIAALARVDPAAIERSARLSYLSATAASLRGDADRAIRELLRAQATAEPEDRAFIARVAFELGALYLRRAERAAADSILLWAQGLQQEPQADLLHLHAMIADSAGDYAEARPSYRAAIASASRALTPLTRVLALNNLAVSLNHVDPAESLSLCGLALAALEVEQLHPRIRPAVRNVMSYALLCLGRLELGRQTAGAARDDAREMSYRRVELFASFNLAIADELLGQLEQADAELSAVSTDAAATGMTDLEGWAVLRGAWLRIRAGDARGARALISARFADRVPILYAETLDMLDAMLALRDEPAAARSTLVALTTSYRNKANELDRFACLLWLALLDHETGHEDLARREVSEACRIGAARGFRVATNFWAPELVGIARAAAPDEYRQFVRGLIGVGSAPEPRRRSLAPVTVSPGGALAVNGKPVPEEVWRRGRTGRRQLRRLFDSLRAAYPSAVGRDELADMLWPESDGDRARVNLYAAVNDLRHLLGGVPGVTLRSDEGRYALQLEDNVALERPSQDAS